MNICTFPFAYHSSEKATSAREASQAVFNLFHFDSRKLPLLYRHSDSNSSAIIISFNNIKQNQS